MENKTCGECKHLNRDLAFCRACGAKWHKGIDVANCKYFEEITLPTNGDRVRTMCNEILLQYVCLLPCEICPAKKIKKCNKNTWDGSTRCQQNWLNWLNAPEESEVEDE